MTQHAREEPAPTEADFASVKAAQAALEARGWQPATLNEMVAAWVALVEHVEHGYNMTIDEYTNDLSTRGWLEEARPFLTERVQTSLDARLDPVDDRFKTATIATSKRLPGGGRDWWYRLPKRLEGELAEDVARMDLSDT
ncbi:MAG: hypothetical protein ACJ77A_16405 [Actinomycetota bacterium]